MRTNSRFFPCLMALACLALGEIGCAFVPTAGLRQREETISAEPPDVRQIEDFDPVTLDENDGEAQTTIASLPESSVDVDTSFNLAETENADESAKTQGYRIQIFVSSDPEGARQMKARAEEIFPEDVYVHYDAPYYKIRIGNCLTRREADLLKERAVLHGYRDAWIVQCLVVSFRK